jgi:hypothetical protein
MRVDYLSSSIYYLSRVKKIVAGILLFIFSLGNITALLFYKFLQIQHQQEIASVLEEFIPKSKLIYIEQNPRNNDLFSWKEENEFYYQGELYDVVASTPHGQTVLYTCLNDSKEKNLTEKLNHWLKQSEENNRQEKNKLITAIHLMATFYFPSKQSCMFHLDTSMQHYSTYCFTCIVHSTTISSPPPKA